MITLQKASTVPTPAMMYAVMNLAISRMIKEGTNINEIVWIIVQCANIVLATKVTVKRNPFLRFLETLHHQACTATLPPIASLRADNSPIFTGSHLVAWLIAAEKIMSPITPIDWYHVQTRWIQDLRITITVDAVPSIDNVTDVANPRKRYDQWCMAVPVHIPPEPFPEDLIKKACISRGGAHMLPVVHPYRIMDDVVAPFTGTPVPRANVADIVGVANIKPYKVPYKVARDYYTKVGNIAHAYAMLVPVFDKDKTADMAAAAWKTDFMAIAHVVPKAHIQLVGNLPPTATVDADRYIEYQGERTRMSQVLFPRYMVNATRPNEINLADRDAATNPVPLPHKPAFHRRVIGALDGISSETGTIQRGEHNIVYVCDDTKKAVPINPGYLEKIFSWHPNNFYVRYETFQHEGKAVPQDITVKSIHVGPYKGKGSLERTWLTVETNLFTLKRNPRTGRLQCFVGDMENQDAYNDFCAWWLLTDLMPSRNEPHCIYREDTLEKIKTTLNIESERIQAMKLALGLTTF